MRAHRSRLGRRVLWIKPGPARARRAGIGKSALLGYAQERAAEMRLLTAHGIESEAEIPFSALFDLLRPALKYLDEIPGQQAAALGNAFNFGPPVHSTRFTMGAACLSLLAANPLALIELAEDAPRFGVELIDRPLAVETRVERAFARQIERLSRPARQALMIAAAAGSVDIEPIIRALQAVGLEVEVLEEPESAGLLRIGAAAVEFRHPLMRSAAYHAASPGERRVAHGVLADAMAAARYADQRAWHLGSARLRASEAAAAALADVAHRALERGACAAAMAAFARAAQLTAEDGARAERLLAAADAAWLSGAGDQAARFLDDARQRACREEVRAEIEHLRARIALRPEPVWVGYDILVRAAREVASVDQVKAALLLAEAAGDALMYAAQVQPMLETARWAWDLARGIDDPEVSFFTSIALGQSLIMAGQGADGARHIRRGLGIIESSSALSRKSASGRLGRQGPPFLARAGGGGRTVATRRRCSAGAGGHQHAGDVSKQILGRYLARDTRGSGQHVSNVFRKLQVVDRAQAVIRVREVGLGREFPANQDSVP